MEYKNLGNTDIKVSPLAVGCMSFGKHTDFNKWSLNYEDTKKVVQRAWELGVNFFDTANVYAEGTSEEYLGKSLKANSIPRDKVVIASKVYFNPGRLSSEAIHREIDGTLERLGIDYLDLYIIHRFDYDTPISETMEALNDLVKSGKVRAIGASAMYGYQFQNMQVFAKENGLAQFQAMEDHYNLLYREDERELIPICKQDNVSLMPYSPLAGGHLAHTGWTTNTARSKNDGTLRGKYDRMEKFDLAIVDRVHELAEKHHVEMSEIALAWEWAKGITAPIVGSTKISHLKTAVNALNVKLTPKEVNYLDELYVPHPIVGAIDHNPPAGTVVLDKK